MSDLGKVTNTLSGNGGKGGGAESACLSGPAVFVDERPTEWLNQKEASARRAYARDTGISGKRSGQTGTNSDVGGR